MPTRRTILLQAGAAVLFGPMGAKALTSYEGIIAQRPRACSNINQMNRQAMSRSAAIATDAITKLKVGFSNFFFTLNAPAERNLAAPATYTASIEYPAGTFTPLLFGGIRQGAVSAGDILFSDYVTVSIPAGATFWVRMFFTCAGGIYVNAWRNASMGDLLGAAIDGLSDMTMGGDIQQVGIGSFPPYMIVGPTTKPSVCVLGDSIGSGFTGNGQPGSDGTLDGRMGIVAASFPTTLGFNNVSSGGQTAWSWTSRSAARAKSLQYCSHVVSEMGINDLAGLGRSSAQLIADLQALWALFPSGTKITQTTMIPLATSTDGFATTANQTANAHLPEIQKFNALLRAGGIAGLNNGYFETCLPLEAQPGDGLWKSGLTADGTHPTKAGYDFMAKSGAIDLSRFAL